MRAMSMTDEGDMRAWVSTVVSVLSCCCFVLLLGGVAKCVGGT